MPNTRNVISNGETVSYEWNGVKLFSLSRARHRIQGETVAQYRARLDRARALNREHMARYRTEKTSKVHEQPEPAVSSVELPGVQAPGEAGRVQTQDEQAATSAKRVPAVDDQKVSPNPSFLDQSISAGSEDGAYTAPRRGRLDGPQAPPPLKGGGGLKGQGLVPSTSPVGPEPCTNLAPAESGDEKTQQNPEAQEAAIGVDSVVGSESSGDDELRRLVSEQNRRIEELFLELAKLNATIGWAKANFPEFLHRLGTVEQQLSSAQPPRKPWLPPVPEAIHEREVQAHLMRESLDPTLREMADYEEGRWPYCAWHLAHAQARNNGVPVTLSLEPRDKMALDHVAVMAEEAAFGDPILGADLLFYWCKRFLSQATDSLEGHSLVDKFLRRVLARDVPPSLPESLAPSWPTSSNPAAVLDYEPIWPVEEVEFQWAQERKQHYIERARRVEQAQEQARLKAIEAQEAREKREQELRDEYQREKAEFEATNAAARGVL